MATLEGLQRKVDHVTSRADEFLAESLRREQRQLERERQQEEASAREEAREHAERRRQVADAFDDSFQAFGVGTPEAQADEHPSAYRRRLYENLRRRLPESHDLSSVRADELPTGKVYLSFEKMVQEAAKAEGLKPSPQNLPRDGSLIKREYHDPNTNGREIRWHGVRSFIADLNRPTRRVLRFVDPRSRSVLLGAPFSRAP
jgi:hypothetical protein